jgi:translocator protein
MKKKTNQGIVLLSFIVAPLLLGYLSSLLSGNISASYVLLYRPDFFPAPYLFPIVWTILYVLMGLSAYLVWNKGGDKKALVIFFVQLLLNLLWSPIFFGMHQYFWAFIELIVLLIAIILTIFSFSKKSKPAAYLMMPYLLWVGFAAILNYVIFKIN